MKHKEARVTEALKGSHLISNCPCRWRSRVDLPICFCSLCNMIRVEFFRRAVCSYSPRYAGILFSCGCSCIHITRGWVSWENCLAAPFPAHALVNPVAPELIFAEGIWRENGTHRKCEKLREGVRHLDATSKTMCWNIKIGYSTRLPGEENFSNISYMQIFISFCTRGACDIKVDRWQDWLRPHALHPGAIQGKEGIKFWSVA